MKAILFLGLCFCFFLGNAQMVSVRKIELNGEKIIIYYDLEDSNPNNEYLLNVYSSKDNYAAPLLKVTGDVGGEVKPGGDHKIEWNIVDEYGPYKGKIALEIRGKVFIPFVKIRDFDTERSYKRGKSYSLGWKAGSTNPINIELYKGGQRVGGEMNQPNNGTHTFYIPPQSKPGNDYKLKITDSKNQEDIVYTSEFKVKPKVPLLVKVLPIVVVGGVLATLGGGTKDTGGGTTTTSDLPKPLLPGN